jgi:hypothetical protein
VPLDDESGPGDAVLPWQAARRTVSAATAPAHVTRETGRDSRVIVVCYP